MVRFDPLSNLYYFHKIAILLGSATYPVIPQSSALELLGGVRTLRADNQRSPPLKLKLSDSFLPKPLRYVE